MEFVENDLVWKRLRKQGVVQCDPTDAEVHLDLDDSSDVVALDVASTDHATPDALPCGVARVPRGEFGAIVEGVLHKLRIVEAVVIPVGHWREVFEAVAEPMSKHAQWAEIDSTAAVELNTRDPMYVNPGSLHLLRDLVDSVATRGSAVTQGVSVAALDIRVLIEVLPSGQMILFAGDAALARTVRSVVEHHASGSQ